jgi:2'-5' RNA ligase
MRLFTALDIPDALRDQIATARTPDALNARWTPPKQYHITLRFVGEVDSETASEYDETLDTVSAPEAECTPYGLDVLPSHRNPSVLIVGLDRTDTLLSVYQAVSDALENAGLDPESRPYRPHVTLARLDDCAPETVHRYLQKHDASNLPSFAAQEFYLYESTLTPDGAVHERRASYALHR